MVHKKLKKNGGKSFTSTLSLIFAVDMIFVGTGHSLLFLLSPLYSRVSSLFLFLIEVKVE